MKIFKNRTILGILCVVLSFIISFCISPLLNSQKTKIVRVAKDIKSGEAITDSMIQTVDVGSYNLASSVMKNKNEVVGKYATMDMVKGDYVLTGKISDTQFIENSYLNSLSGQKQAMSITLKNFANGVSGKIKSGDIVSVIAPDYKKSGTTVIPKELQYVEVVAVTSNKGMDTDEQGNIESDEPELPSTVTLLVSSEQSKILAELEAEGKAHLSLVYRGAKENKDKFLSAQDEVNGIAPEIESPVEENSDEDGDTDAAE